MLCQVCSTQNEDEREYCRRCHQKLLVVSGSYSVEDQEAFENNPEEQYSFDEHLLERISIVEEVVRRTADTVRQSLGTLYKLEQKILVNQTGITTLRDLLEAKGVFGREEWSDLWESRMERQLLALEKRERFAAVKDSIAALYRGAQRDEFLQRLEEAEYSLFAYDVQRAVDALEDAHRLDPENHELAFFLGETFFNDGGNSAALGYFTRVLGVKGDHFESLVYSGVLCHEQGDGTRAEELLKRAVALYPDAFLPTFSLGAVFASAGRLPQATLFLERAVAIDSIPQALHLLGGCYYEMGKVTVAIRHLREAVRLDPSFEEAHHLLGLAYLDRRWYRKALASFRDGQRLAPNKLDYNELVRFLAGRQEPPEVTEDAAECLREAEEAMPRGAVRDALAAYRKALAHDPENPSLMVAYAMACLELGREQEIEPVVEKVLALDPGEPLEVSAYATLMEALRLEGKYREGNRIGRLMLAEGASDFAQTVACYEMACNLADMEEDLDEALSFARRSVEHSPEEVKQFPLAALGWVHYKRREFPQSVDCLSRSNELGSSPRTLTHLGMALLAAGEREQARNVLKEARTAGAGRVLKTKVLEALRDGARLLQDPGPPTRR
ncbi:MAG: tetratricopeptide repeat protein [bacterium]|nr:tetratricopeptide repeat protein [bacterium]